MDALMPSIIEFGGKRCNSSDILPPKAHASQKSDIRWSEMLCCFSAELPGNAYLPPLRHNQRLSEDIPVVDNGFLINIEQDSFGRYAPIFVDYPGIHHLLRQQQEYALDLPFEEKQHNRKMDLSPENDSAANRNW
ncbi:GD16860 [Drosophila simulans]|uniref:GD16860 n=1 Tax=Drosophila simulans TaxID=7240 RepID=B4R674_DROSI|nr:GD16860 [Drosophila simulans]